MKRALCSGSITRDRDEPWLWVIRLGAVTDDQVVYQGRQFISEEIRHRPPLTSLVMKTVFQDVHAFMREHS